MKIDINGKRNISLDFNAPRKFRLTKDGAEIPYIRTGKNSFRLSKNIDGVVDLEEIIEQPRYMQPVQLQPQQMTVINPQDVERLNEAVRQMAMVNPNDVMIINQTAEQLEKNQNFIAQTQKEITDNQVYIDQQQQRLNESALGIQALETNNSQRLDNAETSIYSLASDLDIVKNATIENVYALDSIREQELITQASLETKADKTDVDKIKEELNEYKDDNESFKNALSNYSGGLAVEYSVSEGGKDGQILTKITDETGVYGWKDPTPVIVKAKKMPNPSAKLKGEVYQYVGETGNYTHGYIYECQQNGASYEWVRLDVQPNHSAEIASLTTRVGNLETGKQDKLTQAQMDAVNSGANQSNITQITTNQSSINTINSKIPAQASSSNQLTDKDYVDTADNNLQQQIDAITAASDVTDVVGTYAQLQAYDTSSLPNNSIIKVLQDESRNDETTYYRWVITAGVGAWVLIGEEGPYYTKAESDATFQEKLVSGTNIKTINNNSILGSGNVDIDALPSQTGQSGKFLTTNGSSASWETVSVNPDNKSITLNGSSQLQTVGVIDQNNTSTAIKTWSGTKAQYDAIVTKDANTLYNITDEISQVEIDLNGKANTDLSNVLANIDYVVESQLPTAENNYTWYRKYKSGWVEQGGYKAGSSSTTATITLAVTMADTKYYASTTNSNQEISDNATMANVSIWNRTTTSFQFRSQPHDTYWEVKGMGANQ